MTAPNAGGGSVRPVQRIGPFLAPADFFGPGTRLTSGAIQQAAGEIGVEPAVLAAIVAVEAPAGGVGEDGRPTILFEPHLFSRYTSGVFDRSHPAVSYAKRGTRPYPAKQAARYEQLQQAMLLAYLPALQATSWGLFQILGANARDMGFASAHEVVVDAITGEPAQLRQALALMRAWGLIGALRSRNWRQIAKTWNGAAYAEHGYHTRLAEAYANASKAGR